MITDRMPGVHEHHMHIGVDDLPTNLQYRIALLVRLIINT